ncbi:hypothetical protein F5Y15DRAFT_417249 [Xylariaceae sp. FL0016]|nr:hypothetical protein F5Y15DRAFT_417249 [Xylariaceae sp. FL0016]
MRTSNLLGTTLMTLTHGVLVASRHCHLLSSVLATHDKNAGDQLDGSGSLSVDDVNAWNDDGGLNGYVALSNGTGVDVELDSYNMKIHIDPMGMPDSNASPMCSITITSTTGISEMQGVGQARAVADPGIITYIYDCSWDWDC